MPTDLRSLSLIGIIASLPLAWVTLGHVGGLSLKFVHLFFLGLLCSIVLRGRLNVGAFKSSGSIRVFSLSYTAFIALLGLATMVVGMQFASLGAFAKIIIYFGCFLTFVMATIDDTLSEKTLSQIVFLGVGLGALAFVGYFSYVFHALGRNLPLEYTEAIVTADMVKLRYDFYPAVFNYSEGLTRSNELFTINLKNHMLGSFVVHLVLVNLFYAQARRHLNRFVVEATRVWVFAAALVIVIPSLTRAATLALGIAVALGLLGKIQLGQLQLTRRVCFGGVAVVSLGLLVSIYANLFKGLGATIGERFGEASGDGRFEMFQHAFAGIRERWVFGHGVGAPIQGWLANNGELRAHNLIVGAWYEGGILSCIAVAIAFGCLMQVWLTTIVRPPVPLAKFSLSTAWLAGLPAVPAIGAMVKGSGGHWSLIEWTAVAFFFVLLARHGAQRKDPAQPTRAPRQRRGTPRRPQHMPTRQLHGTRGVRPQRGRLSSRSAH